MIINRSILDKQKFLKFNRDMLNLRALSSKWLGIIGIVIGVVLVVCGICIPNILILGLCLGIFMILLFTMVLFLPKMVETNAGKVFDTNAKGVSAQIFDYCFDEQELTVKNGAGHVLAHGEYENIEQVVETATAFYLVVDARSCFGFVVDKDGFSQGDANQLAEILKMNIEKYVEIV